jgi:hypothetical protein
MPRRYRSAQHAADALHRLRSELEGCGSRSYEPQPGEGEADYEAAALREQKARLESAFNRVEHLCPDWKWRVWRDIRYHNISIDRARGREKRRRRHKVEPTEHLEALYQLADRWNRDVDQVGSEMYVRKVLLDRVALDPEEAEAVRDEVDARVEEELSKREMLISSDIRDEDEKREAAERLDEAS